MSYENFHCHYHDICLLFNLAGKPTFGSLLFLGNSQARTEKLFMRGPGGRGEVEVAVSGISGMPLVREIDI